MEFCVGKHLSNCPCTSPTGSAWRNLNAQHCTLFYWSGCVFFIFTSLCGDSPEVTCCPLVTCYVTRSTGSGVMTSSAPRMSRVPLIARGQVTCYSAGVALITHVTCHVGWVTCYSPGVTCAGWGSCLYGDWLGCSGAG